MVYKITMKFKDNVDDLLEILNKYNIDYEIDEVYEDD